MSFDISAHPEYLSHWITGWNYASVIIGGGPISDQIMSWGTNALLISLEAIIGIKGLPNLSSYFHCEDLVLMFQSREKSQHDKCIK